MDKKSNNQSVGLEPHYKVDFTRQQTICDILTRLRLKSISLPQSEAEEEDAHLLYLTVSSFCLADPHV